MIVGRAVKVCGRRVEGAVCVVCIAWVRVVRWRKIVWGASKGALRALVSVMRFGWWVRGGRCGGWTVLGPSHVFRIFLL